MPKRLLNFAAQISLPFSQAQAEKLLAYAQCVWEKKELLNLTSVSDFDEMINRHLCDGLAAAAYLHAQNSGGFPGRCRGRMRVYRVCLGGCFSASPGNTFGKPGAAL